MSARRAGWIAWSMWVIGVTAISLAAVLVDSAESTLEGALWLSSWVGFGLVGALVVSRRPDNRIGWLLSGITPGIGIGQLAIVYATFALVTEEGRWPLGEVAAWIVTWSFFPVVVIVVTLVLLYPSGAPSRFGRWIFRALLLVATIDALVFAFRPGPVEGDRPPDNPLGIAGTQSIFDPASVWFGNLLVLIALLAVVDAVWRFRRSAGVERLQFRWFLLAIALFPLMFLAAMLLESLVVGTEGIDPVVVVFALSGNGAAAAIGVAVSRYGLYEIDRVISRTVGYVVVVGLLAAVFFGVVTTLGSVLPVDSDLAIAASTLAVAGLFNPLRKRVQGWVDRRFNRSRYDAQRVIDGFVGSLREGIGGEELVDGWVGVVSETMQPRSVAVWVKVAR